MLPMRHTPLQLGGWLTPVLACVELTQCIVQAVPLSSKKQQSLAKSGESPAALLQLPHFGHEQLKKLTRKKVKALAGKQWCLARRGCVGLLFGALNRRAWARELAVCHLDTMKKLILKR